MTTDTRTRTHVPNSIADNAITIQKNRAMRLILPAHATRSGKHARTRTGVGVHVRCVSDNADG